VIFPGHWISLFNIKWMMWASGVLILSENSQSCGQY
jgi:hypothetical protein